ncbi:MAG: ABC transporter substrate-binding protein [Terriglobales bacterium]|jgi:iron complex transport system substrate-binding protein
MSKKKIGLLLVVFVFCMSCSRKASTGPVVRNDQRVLVDMVGRQVVVPKKITRVLGMSPMGTILIYTLSPDLLAGWNYHPDPGELAMVEEKYRNLPVLGGWYGKNNTGNLEEIVKAHPDVLISMGDPLGTAVAERVQEQTHIPVVALNGSLKELPDAYVKAGELLGNQVLAAELAAECRNTLREIEEKVNSIPADKRRRVYYAEGPTGLETEPGNSVHSEALIFAGATNVAAVPNHQGYGHTPVSMEQILQWDPEIVITGYDHTSSPGEFYRTVWKNHAWQHVRAVKHHEVYEVPQYPFCWIDRPPSVNRIIGIKWLASLFYPEVFPYNMRTETRKFYDKFYHRQVSDAELDQLLAAATRNTK